MQVVWQTPPLHTRPPGQMYPQAPQFRLSLVMFRHSLLLAGGAEPNGSQCETLLKVALDACDRYYQAFQFVLWAGKTPREALEGAMFETVGEA